jgi:hypothetical protein
MIDIHNLNYGPVYNPLNNRGLPLLGAWEQARPNTKIDNLSPTPDQYTSYIPFEGPVILNSVWVDSNNDIRYDCGFKKGFSALLFDEDFETAERLIFDKSIFPEFYFNSVGDKVFKPHWLHRTDFGKTLYACHYFINQLVLETDAFDIAPKEIFFNPEWHDPVKSMIGYIPVMRQKSNIDPSKHIAHVKPTQFKGNVEGNIDKSDLVRNNWKLADIDMDITFEVFDMASGEPLEPISMFLNKHREAFPQLIPNFERLRQLLKLLYALDQLKQAGYKK